MSDKSIKPSSTPDNSIAPSLNFIGVRPKIKFDGQCLQQDKVTFTCKKILNIYIVYEINLWAYTQGADFTLGNSLIGAVNLFKNADFNWKFFIIWS